MMARSVADLQSPIVPQADRPQTGHQRLMSCGVCIKPCSVLSDAMNPYTVVTLL